MNEEITKLIEVMRTEANQHYYEASICRDEGSRWQKILAKRLKFYALAIEEINKKDGNGQK